MVVLIVFVLDAFWIALDARNNQARQSDMRNWLRLDIQIALIVAEKRVEAFRVTHRDEFIWAASGVR